MSYSALICCCCRVLLADCGSWGGSNRCGTCHQALCAKVSIQSPGSQSSCQLWQRPWIWRWGLRRFWATSAWGACRMQQLPHLSFCLSKEGCWIHSHDYTCAFRCRSVLRHSQCSLCCFDSWTLKSRGSVGSSYSCQKLRDYRCFHQTITGGTWKSQRARYYASRNRSVTRAQKG